jgi:hypothetical protein
MEQAQNSVRNNYVAPAAVKSYSSFDLGSLGNRFARFHYAAFNAFPNNKERHFGTGCSEDKRGKLARLFQEDTHTAETKNWSYFGVTKDLGPVHPRVFVFKASGKVEGIRYRDAFIETISFPIRGGSEGTLHLTRWDTGESEHRRNDSSAGKREHLIHYVTKEGSISLALSHCYCKVSSCLNPVQLPYAQEPDGGVPRVRDVEALSSYPRVFINGKEVLNDRTNDIFSEPLWSSAIYGALLPRLENLLSIMSGFEKVVEERLTNLRNSVEEDALKRLRDAEGR